MSESILPPSSFISRGLNATQLRIIALVAMTLDHLWATIVPGNMWMHCVGRIAFPLFAFQLTEGAAHTLDMSAYIRRLLVFALISEIPYNLIRSGSPIFPMSQNVMFSLLLGLLGINEVQAIRNSATTGSRIGHSLRLALWAFLSLIGFVDYGILGFSLILLIHFFKGPGVKRGLLLAAFLLVNQFLYKGSGFPVILLGQEFVIRHQAFAILALIPISLYNGEKGNGYRAIQRLSYLYYPMHCAVIYGIWLLLP